MRKIAIVGAGQAGLQLGFGLLAKGYDVTLYSDRTARQVFDGRCTATAFIFHQAVEHERALGLNFWDDEVKPGEGVHLDFCPTPGNILVTVQGRFRRPGMAIDQRLKFSRWMEEFESRGGRLIVRSMSIADVDAVAAEHDLTVVSTGKGELSTLFERDPARSTYTRPARSLALMSVTGLEPWSHVPFHPAKFTLVGSDGEIFWIPFHDKTAGPSWSLVFEAKAGSRFDRFGSVRTGDDMIAAARQVVADVAPWELHRLKNIELTDPLSWAVGAITPVVRKPVAHLPSGRIALGLGDTLVLNDPIAAQGANHASKAAHALCADIVARGDRPFDAPWMAASFEDFWQREARFMTRFSNLFLDPIAPPAQEILLAASRGSAVAEDFFEGFNAPHTLWPWIEDHRLARRRIAERTGLPWIGTAVAARFAVLKGQVGQRLGKGAMRPPALTGIGRPLDARPMTGPAV
ncbi:MAG: styrene monooxygenase/indole monooxygenase family protein [Acidobacteriota bacterium]